MDTSMEIFLLSSCRACSFKHNCFINGNNFVLNNCNSIDKLIGIIDIYSDNICELTVESIQLKSKIIALELELQNKQNELEEVYNSSSG